MDFASFLPVQKQPHGAAEGEGNEGKGKVSGKGRNGKSLRLHLALGVLRSKYLSITNYQKKHIFSTGKNNHPKNNGWK